MPVERLREIPWVALPLERVLPAVERVLAGAAAERVLDKALRGLARDERATAKEAVFGVALWRRRLAWHAGTSEPRALLCSFLRDLAGLPEEAARRLSGTEAQAPPTEAPRGPADRTDRPLEAAGRVGVPERLADRWSLPDWLEATLIEELGAEAEAFCAAVSEPGPICLRANRLRCTREELAAALAREQIETRPAPLAPDGLFVTTPQPNLFGSEAWQRGLFEPQDEGSQLVGELLHAGPEDTILDSCAGAGGKSLQLAARGANVLAHDIDQARLDRLRTRAARAGATSLRIGPPELCDKVLVDAPCSELGTLRRGPDLRWRLDPARFDFPQLQLLEDAARHARKLLVYATCTLRRAENDAVAEAFQRGHPEWRRLQPDLRVLPHTHGTDGFFAASWERLTK